MIAAERLQGSLGQDATKLEGHQELPMRTIATVLAMFAVALGATAVAQSPSFAEVCETQEIPTRAEYESNATAYADNFCALATYAPHRAARQFNSMVALVRSRNNPNRLYWDPRAEPYSEHIQLLRPWMAERGYVLRWVNSGEVHEPVFHDLGSSGWVPLPHDHLATVAYHDRQDGRDIELTIRATGYTNEPPINFYQVKLVWADGVHEAYLDGEHIDGNLIRLTLATGTPTLTSRRLRSCEVTAGVQAVLDCLGDPAVFDSNGAGCDVTAERCPWWP